MIDYEKMISLNGIALNLTDACNLKCIYCFVKQNPHYMSLQVAKDAMDFAVKHSQSEKLKVLLFGGEPLLMWEQVIVPLIDYAQKEKNYNCSFSITTNGTLLSQEKLDFMREHNIELLLSMDGNKETQDHNRPFKNENKSSFDILQTKIPLILNLFPLVTMRSTFVSDNVNKIFDNIMFAKSMGFKHISSFPNELVDWSEDSSDLLKQEIMKYMLYFINAYSKEDLPEDFIRWLPFYDGLKQLEDIKKEILKKSDYKLIGMKTCGLGLTNMAVNYEGDIFGCQELVSYGKENNLYHIGNIYTGLDKDKHLSLLNSYIDHELISEDPEMCQNCIKKRICNKGYCHANSYLRFGKPFKKNRIKCLFDIYLISAANFAYTVLSKSESDNVFKREIVKKVQVTTF